MGNVRPVKHNFLDFLYSGAQLFFSNSLWLAVELWPGSGARRQSFTLFPPTRRESELDSKSCFGSCDFLFPFIFLSLSELNEHNVGLGQAANCKAMRNANPMASHGVVNVLQP